MKLGWPRIAGACAAVALAVGPLAAQEGPSPAEIDALFSAWDRPDSPGCALAVVRAGRLVYARGYGSADLEHRAPITPATPFHLASLSKQFTAYATVLLAAEGRLDLDERVRTYLPELPVCTAPITLRQLLHHTSGLRDQWDLLVLAGWRMDDVITTGDVMRLVKRQRELNFPPGERHLYCNTGYTLLARVVARVAGQPFPEFCRERIFAPLGMEHTHFHRDHRHIVPGRAYSYAPAPGGGFRKAVLSYAVVGATSLFSTAEDLARWQIHLARPSAEQSEVVASLAARGRLNSGALIPYACGLVHGHFEGLRTLGHDGADAGFRTSMVSFPNEQLAVIVLANLASIQAGGRALALARLYLRAEIEAARAHSTPPAPLKAETGVDIAAAKLRSFTGTWVDRRTQALWRVSLHAKGLKVGARTMVALGPRRFRTRRSARPYEIEFPLGEPTGAILRWDNGAVQNLEMVLPADRSRKHLAELAGRYHSPELDVFYDLSAAGEQLLLARRGYATCALRARFRDGYAFDRMLVRFTRDEAGRIDGFRIGTTRVYGLRFLKRARHL